MSELVECPACQGNGLHIYKIWNTVCKFCDGSGLATSENADKYNKELDTFIKDIELKGRIYEFIDRVTELEEKNETLKSTIRGNLYFIIVLSIILFVKLFII